MLNLAAHRKDWTVAIVAGLILLLQSFSTAWATGASAAIDMSVDAWGNPLCITSAGDGSSSNDTAKIPHCCTMGCNMVAAALSRPPLLDQALRNDLAGTEIRFLAANPSVGTSRDHDPGSPRAPPLTA